MEYEEEIENPWPDLYKTLVTELTNEELNSMVDFLRDRFSDEKGRGWRKEVLDKTDISRPDKIRRFINFLSEEQTNQTGFLKLLIGVSKKKQLNFRTENGNVTLKDYLEGVEKNLIEYEKYCKQKKILKDFIGRKEELQGVTRLLLREADNVTGTWISGTGGTGKTTLANQVIGMQSKYRKVYVDLKNAKTEEDFYEKLTAPFHIPPLQRDQKICWETIYEEIKNEKSGMVLFLDSFELLLSPDNQNVAIWKVLNGILAVKNNKVKLLITSIYGQDECMPTFKDPLEHVGNMAHFPLKLFTEEECYELIRTVAPEIYSKIIEGGNTDTINAIITRLCACNTFAVLAVFTYLQDYGIDLEKFLPNARRVLKRAESYDKNISQVTKTLGRVFDGMSEGAKAVLIKFSLLDGEQFDVSMAKGLIKQDCCDLEVVTVLKALLKSHLLQVEDEDQSKVYDQKQQRFSKTTRFFLHSLLQNVLEKKQGNKCFYEEVDSAKSNLQRTLNEMVGQFGVDKSNNPHLVTNLVVRFCSMPKISTDQKQNQSYDQTSYFNQQLQRLLQPKQLEQFYEEQSKHAANSGEKLKWIFLQLSYLEVLLRPGMSESVLEEAEFMLSEVERQLEGIKLLTQATKLTKAHFYLVKGQFLSYRRQDDLAIQDIERALKEYKNVPSCKRQTALALNAIGNVYSLKPFDIYNAVQAMNYYEGAVKKLGPLTLHFDMITYCMNVGAKALSLGVNEKIKIKAIMKKKNDLSQEEKDSYRKTLPEYSRMTDYFEKASKNYDESITLCEKLKMKRSLRYIEVSRGKSLLMLESDDIDVVREAVELAEKTYKLMQEYDKDNKAQMAQCCIAIAQAHKELGERTFFAYKANKIANEEGAHYRFLFEAYHKYKRGYGLLKEGKIMTDLIDYYDWRNKYEETMLWLGRGEKEITSTMQDIERYIKTNIEKRSQPLKSKERLRKKSAPGRMNDNPESNANKRKKLTKQTLSLPETEQVSFTSARKRHSVDLGDQDLDLGVKRRHMDDKTDTVNETLFPTAESRRAIQMARKQSVSDELHMKLLSLKENAIVDDGPVVETFRAYPPVEEQAMDTCLTEDRSVEVFLEEKPSKWNFIPAFWKRRWFGRSGEKNSSVMSVDSLQVENESQDMLHGPNQDFHETKKMDTLKPQDNSDEDSVSSRCADSNLSSSGFNIHPSTAGSSEDMEVESKGFRNSPERKFQGSKVKAVVYQGKSIHDAPKLLITDVDGDTQSPPWLPLQNKNNKISPTEKVNQWLDKPRQKLRRPKLKRSPSPAGSSDGSYHSAIDA